MMREALTVGGEREAELSWSQQALSAWLWSSACPGRGRFLTTRQPLSPAGKKTVHLPGALPTLRSCPLGVSTECSSASSRREGAVKQR